MLFVLANVGDIASLWSINLNRFLPSWWLAVSGGLLVLSFVPLVQERVIARLDDLSQRTRESVAGPVMIGSGIILVCALLFHTDTYFLGDANLRLNQIVSGQTWLPTEAGDFFLHAALYRYVLEPWGLSVGWSYHILSGVAGVLFVWGVVRLAKYCSRERWLLILAVLLASGLLVQFVGYIESYAFLAALIPWITTVWLKRLDLRTGPRNMVLLFALAVVLHLGALFFFSGLVVSALLLPLFRTGHVRLWQAMPIILAVVGVLMLYILRAGDLYGLSYYVIPLVPSVDFNQGLLTVRHWLNVLNWVLCAGLPLVLLVPGLIVGKKRGQESSGGGETAATLWAVTPPIVFVLFFTPHLGGPRDWDLFSVPVYVIMAVVIALWFRRKLTFPKGTLPLVVLPLVLVVSMVWIQAVPLYAVSRFAEIIEVSRFKTLFKEYKLLYTYVDSRPGFEDLAGEYLDRAWKQPPYTPEDSLFTLNKLVGRSIARGDAKTASEFLQIAMATDSLDINTHLSMVSFLGRFGSDQELRQMAELLERRFANDALGRMNAGVLHMRLGNFEDGRRNVTAAFYLDSTLERVLVNYGTLKIKEGDFLRAAELFDRAIAKVPGQFVSHYYAGMANLRMGEVEAARAHLEIAGELAESKGERQRVRSLLDQLREQSE